MMEPCEFEQLVEACQQLYRKEYAKILIKGCKVTMQTDSKFVKLLLDAEDIRNLCGLLSKAHVIYQARRIIDH